MALSDLRAYIVERLQQVDSTLDLTAGSPYDVQVIQPILRRLGTDPFSVDIGLFIQTLLNQQFPDMPTKEGDAITDLLIKAAVVLWNPIVREITRVSNVISLKDPTLLTTDEADALGANLFATRTTGEYATGLVRIYFAQPQNISVSPGNFITSKAGLHFFPTEIQSIRTEEMLLNLEGSLYYFDINVIAEAAGDQYNIAADDLVTIANLPSATRITNKARFRAGVAEETAVEFVNRIDQELTERSLVTSRGIAAKITKDFPEVTRLNVVGFNDPPMQRDIITGGGLGPLLGSGVAAGSFPDGENKLLTRRIVVSDVGVDFTALIGPIGAVTGGYILTVANLYPVGSGASVRDLTVRAVVAPNALDVEEQVLSYTSVGSLQTWTLRKRTLTLSGIPGGILFPDTATGTIDIPDNQIHIGGMTDIFVRGSSFDSDTLVLSSIVDDKPLLSGVRLTFVGVLGAPTGTFQALDYLLGTNYVVGDATYELFARAASENLSIQVLDLPNAGTYRILKVVQVNGASPIFSVAPSTTTIAGEFRWRLGEEIFIDLVEPRETRIAASDLRTVLNSNVVDTISGIDFSAYGVGPGDTLRITTGSLIKGDYIVQAVFAPFFTKLQLDRPLAATVVGAQFSVFRPNTEGGITRPFVRIDSIDLLDTSGQPLGTKIPYAKPIDVRSLGFVNSAHGVKIDVTDGILGIVSKPIPAGASVSALTLTLAWDGQAQFTVTFAGANPLSLGQIVSQINAATLVATAGAVTRFAVPIDNNTRLGLLPVGKNVRVRSFSTALLQLFDHFNDYDITSRDIASVEAATAGGWAGLRPAVDYYYDVAQTVDGLQVGFYGQLVVPNAPYDNTKYDPLRTQHDFSPEVGVHLQVGARSLGSVRCYFLDPTSFEVNASTRFTTTRADGSVLGFIPDAASNYQTVPPAAGGVKPKDGRSGDNNDSTSFVSASTDFVQKGVLPGDVLVLDYRPLVGTVALADPVVGLNATQLIVSINGAADKTIIFIRDSNAIPANAVTRAGVVAQINKLAGSVICDLDGANHLRFNPDASIVIRGSSAASSANALLGFSTVNGVDQNNDNVPNKGRYVVLTVNPFGNNPNQIQVQPPFPSGIGVVVPDEQFKVFRAGVQRLCSTAMSSQVVAPSLYYFDVELVSEGTGDQYNLAAGAALVGSGFRSDGYYLTTDNTNLTFSPVELPKLHLSRTILEVGVSDDPSNATQLLGQNIQLNYDRSTLTNNVDNYARSETERVVNESPLGRHLIPYFVRFAMTYSGGSAENVLVPDIEDFIQKLYPTDSLNVSDLERLAANRGARSVDNPIDLVAVVHNFDRTVTVERSQDYLNTGVLAAFVPDALTVTRKMA
jgi:hypothetical protein